LTAFDYQSEYTLLTKIHFVPHREHSFLPSEKRKGECSVREIMVAYLQESNGTLNYKVWTQYRALRVKVAVCTNTRLAEAEESDIQSCYCLINCTQNVTMRRFHETIVAVEEQKVLHISVCVWMGGG
jgi:uncharacterized protein with NRDE domain